MLTACMACGALSPLISRGGGEKIQIANMVEWILTWGDEMMDGILGGIYTKR